MGRLARHLFTLCSAASLLLCVAVCVLWVRSYSRADVIGYQYSHFKLVGIISTRGAVALSWSRSHSKSGFGKPSLYWEKVKPLPLSRTPGWRTFEVENFSDAHEHVRGVVVPHWLLVTMTAIAPLLWGRNLARTRRRSARRLCPACGYDLRASPERCPECGTAAGGR